MCLEIYETYVSITGSQVVKNKEKCYKKNKHIMGKEAWFVYVKKWKRELTGKEKRKGLTKKF